MSEQQTDNKNFARFLLIFFLGAIGSFIINHSSLRPKGWRSRTCGIFFWSILTFGIYWIVVAIANLSFTNNAVGQSSHIGYFQVRD